MVAKEWQDARWKFLVAAVPVVLLVLLVSPYEEVVKMVRDIPNEDPVKVALRDINDLYYFGGFVILIPLAALLGVASISAEVSKGTILLLLSRPVSRTRLLLTKYVTGAATLLVAAISGKVLLVGVAAVRGYPIGQIRIPEASLSVLVLWLGLLSVLGTALLVSTIFRSVLASVVACVATLFLVFVFPALATELYLPVNHFDYDLTTRLTLVTYWMPTNYYYGNYFYGIGGFSFANFAVCLIAAALPLLAALWIFNRKAY